MQKTFTCLLHNNEKKLILAPFYNDLKLRLRLRNVTCNKGLIMPKLMF